MTNYYKIQILEIEVRDYGSIFRLKQEIPCETDNLKSAMEAFRRTVGIHRALTQINNQPVRIWLTEKFETDDKPQPWEEDYDDCDDRMFWSIIWEANITAEETTIARRIPLSSNDRIIYPQDLA